MSSPRPRTLLATVLKNYRSKYNLTQEQLANDLIIDVRTLRRWESGETIISDVRELKRIADRLGIEAERLGVVATIYTPLIPEKIDEILDGIWHLVQEARTLEARIVIERLVQDLTVQAKKERDPLLYKLAQAHHLAGYIHSMGTRASETALPLAHYGEMETIARSIQDDTLLNIALTYEGDMHTRSGNLTKSIEYLEAARDTTPHADAASLGNGIQLLGRAYLRANRITDFEYAMAEAEKIAATITPEHSTTRGQYSLGTVYEEYGRSYAQLGQTEKAMTYLDLAEASLEPTKHWEILMKTARAMALVQGGEIESGIKLAVEATALCKKYGTIRLLERIYSVQRYLDKLSKKLGQAGTELQEALDGPVEQAF